MSVDKVCRIELRIFANGLGWVRCAIQGVALENTVLPLFACVPENG